MIEDIYYQTDNGALPPQRAHVHDAGLDLFVKSYDLLASSAVDEPFYRRFIIDSGVHCLIPENHVGLVLPRSSLSKAGLIFSTGVIDAGYTGTIQIIATSFNKTFLPFIGQKIAQLVITPILTSTPIPAAVDSIKTDRGANGFGSTGA